jgi:hypothetical protein
MVSAVTAHKLMKVFGSLVSVLLLLVGTSRSLDAPCSGRNTPTFDDFKVSRSFKGVPKAPVLRTRSDREYRTSIRNAVKSGANFAGHYSVAEWGCGTGCHGFVVVDVVTGTVYDPPFTDINFHQPEVAEYWENHEPQWWCLSNHDVIEYRADSDLLVVEGCLDDHQCGRTYYRIGVKGLQQIAFDPDRLPHGDVAPQ